MRWKVSKLGKIPVSKVYVETSPGRKGCPARLARSRPEKECLFVHVIHYHCGVPIVVFNWITRQTPIGMGLGWILWCARLWYWTYSVSTGHTSDHVYGLVLL